MPYEETIAGQILAAHIKAGRLAPGEEIGIRIDQTLTQDATGTLAYLQFMALKVPRVRTKLSVSYVDHNTLQSGSENADDHLFLQTAAARHGVYFSRPGNGISHQVHLERFGVPGETLLGSDSHTPTAGGLGMLGIGAGGLDVALAMAGGLFYLKVPKVRRVLLSGALPPWVGAKDVILYLLQKLTVKGGLGWIMEYDGPGVTALSVTERATITNMGAELGAWSSLFPSDERTRHFLTAQGRERDWRPVHAGKQAAYDDELVLDLKQLEPLAAQAGSPDAVVPITALSGTKVDQAAIGSCTNSSYADLKLTAEILRGKKVHPETSLVIAPGSRQVLAMLARDGTLADLVESGARVLEVACGPCIGMGQAPPSRGVSVRTFNRNFPGRSGTPDAAVYLSGPQVAAVAALYGAFRDPRELGAPPQIAEPERYPQDDGMIIPPPAAGTEIPLRMGPNIKPLPGLEPLPEKLRLPVLIKLGDNISTDDILPGGAKVLPLRSNLPAIAEFVLARQMPDFAARAKSQGAVAIVGGDNYGQGSSREHAALAPRFLGVRVVLARSLARLHRANLINFGVLPLLINEDAYRSLEAGTILEFTELRESVLGDASLIIKVNSSDREVAARIELSARERDIVLSGGTLNHLRRQLQEQ